MNIGIHGLNSAKVLYLNKLQYVIHAGEKKTASK